MTARRKILIVPFTGQGNLNPALQFSHRLINMGVDVTFCTSLSIIQRLDKDPKHHRLTFIPFSDGHENGKQKTTTLQQVYTNFETNGASTVTELIRSAVATGQPFDHFVYAIGVPWAAHVAKAEGIRCSVLWSQSATVLNIYYHYFNECQYQGLLLSNQNNPSFSINLPRLPPLTTDDLPSYILPSNPEEDGFIIPLYKDHIDSLKFATNILVNTFAELEVEGVKPIEQLNFLPVGPLIPLTYNGKDSSNDSFSKDDCIQWLNTKPKSSVVYVSFGTMVTLSMDQMEEIAIGLLESRRPFLWVIRDSEQLGRLNMRKGLKKQGMIVEWCSQMAVLCHQAIGCFVTHGGWNSTLETMAAGVPTVVFPQWSDQGTNAKMIEDVWKTGVRLRRKEGDRVVEGKEIERCVEMVMGDDDMKRNSHKLRELAREAMKDGGASTINLQTFLNNI